ncbi:hypothetical protein CVT26_003395 [Gymnopilus dilepis]|uniref:HMG box domain-containing protein n=1 Tax=Gymnopilus dilepis TaxID=231916 RepID=A0A409Y5A8_9AGAR|nr:hypothetical protein CVT26_003395 [Gymnopilus dilepis]
MDPSDNHSPEGIDESEPPTRPPNGFILFRNQESAKHGLRRDTNPNGLPQGKISTNAGQLWRELPQEERDKWNAKSRQLNNEYDDKYPDYKHIRKARKKVPKSTRAKKKKAPQENQHLLASGSILDPPASVGLSAITRRIMRATGSRTTPYDATARLRRTRQDLDPPSPRSSGTPTTVDGNLIHDPHGIFNQQPVAGPSRIRFSASGSDSSRRGIPPYLPPYVSSSYGATHQPINAPYSGLTSLQSNFNVLSVPQMPNNYNGTYSNLVSRISDSILSVRLTEITPAIQANVAQASYPRRAQDLCHSSSQRGPPISQLGRMRQQGIPSDTFDAHHQQVMPPNFHHRSSSQNTAAFRPHSPALNQWQNAAAYDPSTSSPAFATFEQPFIQPPSAATQFPGALRSEQVVDNDQILADLPQKLYHLSIPMSRGLGTTPSSDSGYSGLAGALDLPVQTRTSYTTSSLPGGSSNAPSTIDAQVQGSSRQGYYDNPTSYTSHVAPSKPLNTLTTTVTDPSQGSTFQELQAQGFSSQGYYDNSTPYVAPITPSVRVNTSTTAADGTYQALAFQDFHVQ